MSQIHINARDGLAATLGILLRFEIFHGDGLRLGDDGGAYELVILGYGSGSGDFEVTNSEAGGGPR